MLQGRPEGSILCGKYIPDFFNRILLSYKKNKDRFPQSIEPWVRVQLVRLIYSRIFSFGVYFNLLQ